MTPMLTLAPITEFGPLLPASRHGAPRPAVGHGGSPGRNCWSVHAGRGAGRRWRRAGFHLAAGAPGRPGRLRRRTGSRSRPTRPRRSSRRTVGSPFWSAAGAGRRARGLAVRAVRGPVTAVALAVGASWGRADRGRRAAVRRRHSPARPTPYLAAAAVGYLSGLLAVEAVVGLLVYGLFVAFAPADDLGAAESTAARAPDAISWGRRPVGARGRHGDAAGALSSLARAAVARGPGEALRRPSVGEQRLAVRGASGSCAAMW